MPPATASCTARAPRRRTSRYVLGVLTAEQLAHAFFPLGETPSKALVRAEAAARGLTRRAQARQPRHLLHPRRRHPRLARRARRRRDGRHRRPLRRGRRLARGRARVHGRPAPRTARSACPRPTASRGSCSRCVRRQNTVVVGPEGGARDRRDRRVAVHLGRAAAGRCRDAVRVRRADPRARRPGAGGRGASTAASSSSPRSIRSTASRPARPRSSTSARACSASSRSTAR